MTFRLTKSKVKNKDSILKDGELYCFNDSLNSDKNLNIALELIKLYKIKKDVPRTHQLYYILEYSPSDCGDWLGVRCYIKLKENGFIIIYKENIFEKTILVNIKLKKLKSVLKDMFNNDLIISNFSDPNYDSDLDTDDSYDRYIGTN